MSKILEAADLLNNSKCYVILFQCTGTSMSGGVEMDRKVISEIASATGRPAISTASALNAAFEALGAKRLAVLSETAQAGHAKKLKYLREAVFEIVADKAMGLSGSDIFLQPRRNSSVTRRWAWAKRKNLRMPFASPAPIFQPSM